jgi:hypothetical protein
MSMGRKTYYLNLVVWLSCSSLVGCGRGHPVPSELYLESGYLDIDGKVFPGVYGLVVDPPADQLALGKVRPSCTATAISPTVLVTAAHCLKRSDRAFIYYLLDFNLKPVRDADGAFLVGEAVAHPLSQFVSGHSWRQSYDLAFIRFQTPSFATFYSFMSRDPVPGSDVQLVGYGMKRGSQDSGRQYGANKLVSLLREGSIDPLGHPVRPAYFSLYVVTLDRVLNTDPQHPVNSGTVPGDSGGPLFTGNQITGILYGGAYWNQLRDEENEEDRGRFDDSVYVNPRALFHQEFIKDLRQENWDIPPDFFL